MGGEVDFSIPVNSYENNGKRAQIGYNTVELQLNFWYTQSSYGLLSFYGIDTPGGFGGNGQFINLIFIRLYW